MPVTGRSRALRFSIVQLGEMRRSDEEFSQITRTVISALVCRDIFDDGDGGV